ncbi:uncharacterized protein [Fopius arisanus]|uniref:Uncharacterized protein n=1 Tax=Fopius arisanus TaxID=64838 RepID=A0A0C9RST5_9HYME|nr:PREDICTED: uncharacterized protein LOC105265125 [Fopius arisanus]XP_011300749.1 PREDICTED: uncharacterized protein LOC105265125 [Fopius arisanus]XP_011300750.1 PREDICTED: uncharacterized protein LOC105265125 [Fopius arisanus]
MLVRTSSSRRRRASRSVVNSPQGTAGSPSGAGGIKSRRASVATDKPFQLPQNSIPGDGMGRQRSPRSSIVPNIALNAEDDEEPTGRRFLPDPELCASTRGLLPNSNRSPRNSLIPEEYCRSPRGSLVPDAGRSPRNSLLPDGSRSPRHSLVPDGAQSPRNPYGPEGSFNRSPRGSPLPGVAIGVSRNSLMPDNGDIRSSRYSLVPDTSRSPRGSIVNIEFDRTPRGSLCPEISRSPRGSIVPPIDIDRTPRGSICPDISSNRSPRGSISSEYHNPSPRGSIMPEPNRSPRGSICLEGRRSPPGCISPFEGTNRTPRGSIGVPDFDRNLRESGGEQEGINRSPRGSIGPGIDRSPRGSLGGYEKRNHRGNSLTPQEPRRASADQGLAVNRSSSPYRQRDGNSTSVRSGGNQNVQTNLGYGTNAWAESRRASSSVSQFSGDESRRLCMRSVVSTEKGACSASLGVATYGSLVFQLKESHREASGTCDFVLKAMRVVSKTMVVTICLVCLSTVPLLMLIMGLQYIKDCPKEPHIPVYMIVGGTLGSVRMFWALYSQIRSRRLENTITPPENSHISPMQLVSITLTLFLTGWFVLGNYWILKIKWPEYTWNMYEPDRWCHKTLYVFAITHLGIIYAAIGMLVVTAIGLAFCRVLACPWFERYK